MLDRASVHNPQIFQYLDYRSFLADYFRWRRQVEPGFSLRVFSRLPDLGLTSSSFLSAVLKGRKNLSQPLRLRIGRALRLGTAELAYFETLVQYNQSRTADERSHHFAQLSRHHPSPARTLDATMLRLFSRWYYRVVWNYFAIRQDQNSPAQIAKAIHPPITPAEVEEAVKVLLELRLIKRLANGYAPTDRHIAADPASAGAEALAHQREMLSLALENLDRVPPEARQYGAMTFSISARGMARVMERLDAFRGEVRDLVEGDEGGDRILALGMQLFPVAIVEPGPASGTVPGTAASRSVAATPAGAAAGGTHGGASCETGNPGQGSGPALHHD
jgi:uncharacterized protein (TIGR02147 family)